MKHIYFNKLILKPALTSLLVLSMLVTSVYAYISNASRGWFASNDKVSAITNIGALKDYTIQIAGITVYKYDTEEKTYISEYQNTTDADWRENMAELPLDLNPYDAIFSRNDKTPMLIKVDLYNTLGDPFKFTFSCDDNLYTDAGGVYRYFANVVSVKCGMSKQIDTLIAGGATPGAICAKANEIFRDDSGANAGSALTNKSDVYIKDGFTTAGSPPSVKQSLVFSSVNTGSKRATGDYAITTVNYTLDSNNLAHVYLYIDYDSALIDYYLNKIDGIDSGFLVDNININLSTPTDTGTADFLNDIAFMKIERVE